MGPVAGNAVKGKQNRKQAAKLERRMRDWSAMINSPGKKDYSGYHRPGSNNK